MLKRLVKVLSFQIDKSKRPTDPYLSGTLGSSEIATATSSSSAATTLPSVLASAATPSLQIIQADTVTVSASNPLIALINLA